MRGSFKLFKLFGISIDVHVTFLLLPIIFGLFYGLKGIVLIFLVFFCVTSHELCHSVVAKRFGIRVDSITLLPIGGLAAMRSIPEKPIQEFTIAIAGPLFNLALATALLLPAYYGLGPENLFQWPPGLESWPRVLAWAFWINPILAGFNLLPAFPMDGGRVVRAFLAKRMDYKRATEVATGLGHLFAIVFGFVGIMKGHIILIVIAIFIYIAASQEELQVDIRLTLKRFYVDDILARKFSTVTPETPLSKVLELAFHTHQEDFPVLEDRKLVGFLTRAELVSAVHQYGLGKFVGEVMKRHFPTVRPKDRLTTVQKKMEEFGVKAIPVLKDAELVGIVTLEDVSRVYMMISPRE